MITTPSVSQIHKISNTSDHPVPERVPKWNFKKVKWDAFQDQCNTEKTPDIFNDAEDKTAILSSTLFDIAADNIPKTSPFPKRKAKPWFDEDCQVAKRKEIELVYQLINILVLSIQCEHS